MAVQLQLVFNEVDEKRNKLAILKRSLKDQLESLADYQSITDELEVLNQKKKQLIANVMSDNKKEVEEIDKLTLDLKSQKQLISDVALKDYLAGKKIEIVKPDGAIMEPVFSVKFVKTGEYKKLSAAEKRDLKNNGVKIPERLDLE